MGKRSRNKTEEPEIPKTREEELAEIDRDYRGIKRMMTVGALAVGLLILGLVLRQPDGWVVGVVVLALIEGISYPLLRKSLDRRRDERIASLDSAE